MSSSVDTRLVNERRKRYTPSGHTVSCELLDIDGVSFHLIKPFSGTIWLYISISHDVSIILFWKVNSPRKPST